MLQFFCPTPNLFSTCTTAFKPQLAPMIMNEGHQEWEIQNQIKTITKTLFSLYVFSFPGGTNFAWANSIPNFDQLKLRLLNFDHLIRLAIIAEWTLFDIIDLIFLYDIIKAQALIVISLWPRNIYILDFFHRVAPLTSLIRISVWREVQAQFQCQIGNSYL